MKFKICLASDSYKASHVLRDITLSNLSKLIRQSCELAEILERIAEENQNLEFRIDIRKKEITIIDNLGLFKGVT